MLTTLGQTLLFLTSYGPLFFILTIRQYDVVAATHGQTAGSVVIAIGILTLAVPALAILVVFKEYDKIRGQKKELDGKIESIEKDALLYFVTYVIPFLDVGKAGWTDAISYAIIFTIIYALYVRSGLIYLNPMLSLLRYKTYKISTPTKSIVLITKVPYNGDRNVERVKMAEGVYYEPRH